MESMESLARDRSALKRGLDVAIDSLKSWAASLSALTRETLLSIGQASSTARNCYIFNPLLLAK